MAPAPRDGLDAERDDTDFGLQYPTENFGLEHLLAIPDTPASPGGCDMSEDDETLSWPIFVKYQGSSTTLLVCDGMSIASLKNAICDRLNIPPHAQSLTTNSTTGFLMDHMTIQQCGITRDATVQVLIRGRGGMIDSFQGAVSTPYLTPNKGSGFLRHLGTPPNGLVRPPPPPALPVEQDDTTPGKTNEDSTRHAVDNLLQSTVRQGLTSVYNWCEVSGPPGTRVEDKWYVDGKAVCPRPAMLRAMYAIQPWEVEMGDGCTIPSQGALLPPIPDSIQLLRLGQTAFWAVPTSNDPDPKHVHVGDTRKRDPWIGNQRSILTAVVNQLQKYHKTSQPPVHMWIVLTTRQAPVVDPLMVLQLDGRHMVRLLRRKCCYVLMDKSGHWVRWDRNASQWQRQSFWDESHLAILIRSDVEWMRMSDLQHSYVANPNAIRTIPEMPPTVWRVVMPAFIDSHNAFLRELNDSGEVGTATAKRHSKIPWAGVRQLPQPDEFLQLFEYTCPAPYTSTFLELLRREEPPPQFVELTNVAHLHVIQQAKPRKGNTASVSSVQCAADLEAEIYGALEVDEPADRDRTRMFLTQFFPQGVPHMRFQRLIHISPDVPITELAMRLWTGGRLFLKHVHSDERVWFGQLGSGAPGRDTPILPEHPNEIVLQAPTAAPLETIRLCAAQFGAFESVEDADKNGRQHLRGKVSYRIRYQHASSAVLAHGVVFDLAAGEATVTGRDAPDEAEALFRQLPETNDTNVDPNWWRFEVGRSLGAEEAVQAEDHRLTATALAFHDALPPEETASMQL